MDWVYGARYTTANTLMPQLTYEKRFKVLKGLHVSLNGNYNFGKSYSADTASCNYNWLGQSQPKGVPGELSYMKYRYRDHKWGGQLPHGTLSRRRAVRVAEQYAHHLLPPPARTKRPTNPPMSIHRRV